MKTRIMFYLLLMALFGFSGNSFAMEESPEINTPEEYDEIIGTQGVEGLNTLYGIYAGLNITTGIYNSFFGFNAGYSNTSTDRNSFFGFNAGFSNLGHENSFFGATAGQSNTTGTYNSFFGANAGQSNITGVANSFFGRGAGYSNTTAGFNCFFGRGAGYSNTTGKANSFFGDEAGQQNTTGSGNVFLGYEAGYYEGGSNKLYIDNSYTAFPLIWGDFSTNNVVIHGGFRAIASYTSSDQRWKKDIQPLESSLDKISNLQGVSYEWKTDEYPDFGLTEGKQIGLVAQDVESVLPELVSEDKDGYKAVSYTKLTAVLVEAVKELKTENQSQKKVIKEQQHQFEKQLEEQRNQFRKQQTEIEELRSMIKEMKS